MDPSTYMPWFFAAVILINALTYGGVTWVYFKDKRRVDPPKPSTELAVDAVGSSRSDDALVIEHHTNKAA